MEPTLKGWEEQRDDQGEIADRHTAMKPVRNGREDLRHPLPTSTVSLPQLSPAEYLLHLLSDEVTALCILRGFGKVGAGLRIGRHPIVSFSSSHSATETTMTCGCPLHVDAGG
jgi:hypothetical protein